jgi:hypothetical protein
MADSHRELAGLTFGNLRPPKPLASLRGWGTVGSAVFVSP